MLSCSNSWSRRIDERAKYRVLGKVLQLARAFAAMHTWAFWTDMQTRLTLILPPQSVHARVLDGFARQQ